MQQCLAEQKGRVRQLHTERMAVSGKGSARRRERLQREFKAAAQTLSALQQRLRQYQQDNQTNPTPYRMVLRADSHFGTPATIQRLLELGYELLIKSYSASNPAYKRHFESSVLTAVPRASDGVRFGSWIKTANSSQSGGFQRLKLKV